MAVGVVVLSLVLGVTFEPLATANGVLAHFGLAIGWLILSIVSELRGRSLRLGARSAGAVLMLGPSALVIGILALWQRTLPERIGFSGSLRLGPVSLPGGVLRVRRTRGWFVRLGSAANAGRQLPGQLGGVELRRVRGALSSGPRSRRQRAVSTSGWSQALLPRI
ncbi:MAG: hypothetical protein KatS3mg008_2087 [Acidimicrobiales bacterium]|nr:MAG: hypothetical protein KatS3mg008_2087 [Acidimicrobiales bacterium]